MNTIEKSILNQMWIYTAALRTIYWLRAQDKYSEQIDVTIDNISSSASILLIEVKRQYSELKCQ